MAIRRRRITGSSQSSALASATIFQLTQPQSIAVQRPADAIPGRGGVNVQVQAKLAGRGTGLEDVNLLEVEMEMLVAKRKQLVEDEEPDAGFRVYGGGVEEGAIDGASPPEEI